MVKKDYFNRTFFFYILNKLSKEVFDFFFFFKNILVFETEKKSHQISTSLRSNNQKQYNT